MISDAFNPHLIITNARPKTLKVTVTPAIIYGEDGIDIATY